MDLERIRFYIKVEGKGLLIYLSTSCVGYDVYSAMAADGKEKRGYLPAGRYGYSLKLSKGAYLLKVRVGDRVKEIRGTPR